jgi:sugar/nucleoside kinase (ribokinase family)
MTAESLSASQRHDTRRPAVLCAGILVADIFVPPLPALPAAGALCATEDFLLDTGGCAANVAAGLARLGVRAAVAGRVGPDVFGEFIVRDLERRGVDTSGVKRSDAGGTSKTVVLTVIGEDRRFLHTFGANARFRVEDIDISPLSSGGILYLGGYLVMPDVEPEALANLFRAARQRGVRTVLDVVVPAGAPSGAAMSVHSGGMADGMQRLAPVLPFTDFFLPNDEEALSLTGEIEPRAQAARFLAAGCGAAVITQGKRGTLLMTGQEVLEVGVYPVEFVDGSGSGDAFAAGFILGLLEGWPLPDVLRFGSAVGASACTKLGCTTGVFTRPQAEAFIREHTLEVKRVNW